VTSNRKTAHIATAAADTKVAAAATANGLKA